MGGRVDLEGGRKGGRAELNRSFKSYNSVGGVGVQW